MDSKHKENVRLFLKNILEERGDRNALSDDESIFVSGRLDSFSMMNLVVHLEQSFGINFSETEFDVTFIDSVNDITAFVDAQSMG